MDLKKQVLSKKGSIASFLIFLVLGISIILLSYNNYKKNVDIVNSYQAKPFASFSYDAAEEKIKKSKEGGLIGIVLIFIGIISMPFGGKKIKKDENNEN
jgi:hypothetical protein